MQLNIALETERGQSDEGDPWFVFCRANGDVLVHFARFDGLYHLHAPVVPLNLKGPSFEQLARRFVDQYPVNIAAKRDPKIILHPSAIFTILIAAAVFASDHGAQAATLDPESNSGSPVLGKHSVSEVADPTPMPRGDKQAEAATHAHLSSYFNAVAAAAAIIFNVLPHDFLSAPVQFDIHSQPVSDLIDITGVDGPTPAPASDFRVVGPDHHSLANAEPSQISDSWSHISESTTVPAVLHNDSWVVDQQPMADPIYMPPQRATFHDEAWDGSEFHVSSEFALLQHPYLGAAPRGSGGAHPPTVSSGQSEQAASSSATSETAATPDDTATSSTANNPQADTSHVTNALATWNQVLNLIATWTHGSSSVEEASASAAATNTVAPLTAADQTHYTAAAALTIKNFILSFETAKVVVRDGNILVFDGLTAGQDSSASVMKTWELDNGATISIIGHADHPIHYELVA